MCCFGVPLRPVAEPIDGPWASRVREIAAAAGVVVVVGMFTPDGDRVRNTLLATGPGVEASYDKIHMFDAFGFRESATVAPGADLVTDRRRRRVRRTRHLLRHPLPVAVPAPGRRRRSGARRAPRPGEPAQASASSGSCWPGRARWTPPRTCLPAGRPIRSRSGARRAPRRLASGTASRSARSVWCSTRWAQAPVVWSSISTSPRWTRRGQPCRCWRTASSDREDHRRRSSTSDCAS